jgi:hypothetical protein
MIFSAIPPSQIIKNLINYCCSLLQSIYIANTIANININCIILQHKINIILLLPNLYSIISLLLLNFYYLLKTHQKISYSFFKIKINEFEIFFVKHIIVYVNNTKYKMFSGRRETFKKFIQRL